MRSTPSAGSWITAAAVLALALSAAGGEPGAAPPPPAADPTPFEGLWRGAVVYEPARLELELLVELARDGEGRLAGTIDLPIYHVQYRPLEEVRVEGRAISFVFRNHSETRGPDAPYTVEGELTADGGAIAGEFVEHTGRKPFRLERIGGPFAERAPAADPPLHPLAGAGDELKAAFNRDAGHVRLVLLLSPKCVVCLSSAQLLQRYVFETFDGEEPRGYLVWGPMLGGETEADGRAATPFLPDPRVTHYWTSGHELAESLSGPLGLPAEEPAWDTFLLYPPGITWGEEPPKPGAVMHVGRSLPAEQRLDAIELRARIAELIGGGAGSMVRRQ